MAVSFENRINPRIERIERQEVLRSKQGGAREKGTFDVGIEIASIAIRTCADEPRRLERGSLFHGDIFELEKERKGRTEGKRMNE